MLKIIVNSKKAFYDSTHRYLLANLMVSTVDMTASLDKALWLYVAEKGNIDYVSFMTRLPAVMMYTRQSSNAEVTVCNVFHIIAGQESITIQAIETNFGMISSDKVNSIIIVDDLAEIGRISLSSRFNVLAYATIDDTGTVTYYSK